MIDNIVKASFVFGRTTKTRNLHQWDYGQVLQFEGLDLPNAYTVHFANQPMSGNAKTQIGGPDGVTIPDEYLTTGLPVYAWVFLHAGADDGETVYMVTIPVTKRPKPTEDEPTPVQQGAIDQAIAALSEGVSAAEGAAMEAEESASAALLSAREAGESADEASASARVAEGSTTEAAAYADDASQSANSAAQSATQAGNEAANANTYASAAMGYAGQAAQSASEARVSAENAASSADDAADSARAASESENTASTAAQTAITQAGNATTASQTATQKAASASQSATAAAASETNAKTSETNAATSETNAATSADDAADSALEAKGYRDELVGELNGVAQEDTAQTLLTETRGIATGLQTLIEVQRSIRWYDELPAVGTDGYVYITSDGIYYYDNGEYTQVSGGGDLNGFSLSKDASDRVVLTYINPDDETDTDSAVMATATTGDAIADELKAINASLKTMIPTGA